MSLDKINAPFCYEDTFFNSINISIKDIIKIPAKKSVNEICFALIVKHKIPEFATEGFKNFITIFIDNETHQFQSSLIKKSFSDVKDINAIALNIEEYYHETWSDYKSPKEPSDFEIFGNTYLKLVEKSPNSMDSIARLELQFSLALADKVAQRDLVLSNLDEKYMASMKELEKSSSINKQSEINRFEQQYHQNRLRMEINWNSDISALREEQKRDFRVFIMNAFNELLLNPENGRNEEINNDNGLNGFTRQSVGDLKLHNENKYRTVKNISRSKSTSTIFSKLSDFNKKFGIMQDPQPSTGNDNKNHKSVTSNQSGLTLSDSVPWEESFTIHLGRQMRSTHNMRIISVDPLDLLSLSSLSSEFSNSNDLQSEIMARRLNTVLSLYSRKLTGMVLLVDRRLNTYSGMKSKFAHLCEKSTDFHFSQLEQQLDEISKVLGNIPTDQKSPSKILKSSQYLEVGDVYITCHSNLNDVGVVFHLVIDESDIQKDIRYPSPIHNAIRNILRTCFLHDIFYLNMPLLLTHQIKEYMTNAWCTRRVETILKAVKGAMMELCTWRGRESRTIQFVVPRGIPDEMLSSFSLLLTDYFQLSKAVK